MKTYKDIYSFRVLEEIKAGKTVFVVDRHARNTTNGIREANTMYAENLIHIIESDNSNHRYDFFVIEDKEEKNA